MKYNTGKTYVKLEKETNINKFKSSCWCRNSWEIRLSLILASGILHKPFTNHVLTDDVVIFLGCPWLQVITRC